jgi:hypothetical protein
MELPVSLKKSSLIRKTVAWFKQVTKMSKYYQATPQDYLDNPPILINSFPKSGTHLLTQIAGGLPGHINYDMFIASMPSLTFRERSRENHLELLKHIVPGEIVSAHLFFDPLYAEELKKRNCVHLFVYRDFRDIVISEAYYLTFMNRWHRMHSYYRNLPNMDERISLSILGLDGKCPYDYPNVTKRFERYEGWLNIENVFPVKFEDLVGENRSKTIENMMRFYASHLKNEVNIDSLVTSAINNIAPEKSHTFRKGESGGWKKAFTPKHKQQIIQVASEKLASLGYEPTPQP